MNFAIAYALVCSAILPAACSADPSTGKDLVLENASTRLVLRDNRIASMFDKVRSIEHVAPQAGSKAGLFNLRLVKGIEPAVDLDATQMTSRAVHQAADALEMEFTHAEATVRITVRLSSSQAAVAWSISVVPANKALAVGSAACPVFETPVSSDGSVKNCLLPLYEGRLHPVNVNIVAHKPKVYPVTTICRGSPFGKSFMQDMAARLFDLGATGFHGDQDSGPTPDGVTGCFNPDHGHPIPCGPWSIESTRHAYREIRAEAARRGITDFLLTKEHCTELLNMEIHGYLARMEWTYSQPHVVPLSQFLYHEFLPVVLDPATDGLADQIILGVIAASRDATSPLFEEYCRAMQAYAKGFLLYGRMLKPLIAEGPVSRKPAKGKAFLEGTPSVTAEISIPLIRHSAWEDGAGGIGVFAINTQTQETTVEVPAPEGGPWEATFYLGAEQQQTQAVRRGQTLPWRLEPDRLAAIVFKPGSVR